MNGHEKLHSALAALDPAALNYSEWTRVGMALKEAGEGPEVWDAWSARDPARYHPGECGRKWATFAGSSTPVTAASIFELARRMGWQGGTSDGGHAMDWDSVIAADGALAGPGVAKGTPASDTGDRHSSRGRHLASPNDCPRQPSAARRTTGPGGLPTA